MTCRSFYKYFAALYPDHRLTRVMEDCCDTCTRIKEDLCSPHVSADDKEILKAYQFRHIADSMSMRTVMREVIARFAGRKLTDTLSVLSDEALLSDLLEKVHLIPTNNEDALVEAMTSQLQLSDSAVIQKPIVQLQLEDYGGNLVTPSFKMSRPSKDYYASNLLIFMFVVCNLSDSDNCIYLYDERAQGKDCEALCNLRFRYHLELYHKRLDAGLTEEDLMKIVLYLIMDNCVGQNKSQVVLKFYLFLSLVFYDSVVAHYNISGHSHMANDVTTAHAKGPLKRENIFDPKVIADRMSTVKGIRAEFIDHRNADAFLWTGWEDLLDKHMPDINSTRIEGGYTSAHFFEFARGSVTIRDLATTEVIHVHTYIAPERIAEVRSNIIRELVGKEVPIADVKLTDIILPKHPLVQLSEAKIKSMSSKMFSIPTEYRSYYPSCAADDDDGDDLSVQTKLKSKKQNKRFQWDEASQRTPSIATMFKAIHVNVNKKLGNLLTKQATKVKLEGALDKYLVKRGVDVPSEAYTTSVQDDKCCSVQNAPGNLIDTGTQKAGNDSAWVPSKRRKNDHKRPMFSTRKCGRWTNTTIYGYAEQDLMIVQIELKQAQMEFLKKACSVVHTEEERREALRYLLTQEMSQREDVRIGPSRYKAKNNANNKYDRDIGSALITTKAILANERVGTDLRFRGVEISQGEWEVLPNKCYCVHLRNGVYLDCYPFYLIGMCYLSFGNSSKSLQDSDGKAARANAELVSWVGEAYLKAREAIPVGDEVNYSMGPKFSLAASHCPENTVSNVRVQVQLKHTPLTESWYNNTQSDGFCGWLAIIALTCGLEKIHLEVYRERLFVIEKLEEFRVHVPAVVATQIEQLVIVLKGWGDADLEKPIWLPRNHPVHGTLWLSTADFNEYGPFLRAFLKCNVWAKSSSGETCYSHTGTNDDTKSFRFTYSDWMNELLKEDYKHVFYSDAHYYQGPEYSSLWLREQFRAAFSDLVGNLYKKLFEA
jgi:hypothetical protein